MSDHTDTPAHQHRRQDWLTTAELAQEYGFAIGTLRYWRHTGYGPASFTLGRKVVYRREAVEAWIAEQEQRTRRGGTAAA
ncbi:helix-turn-helix transcriptional regulator [Nocardia fluminea]|uniref:Helix-turn-helix protein n=1 Tax=Nocardia fluminea TaxID=134984 RepID=A0A2N3VFX6_9NOCA|nr:helix-turn-helix domain-containing protein [Nocardia fluminea]PKV80511.1 helix-turn-helix protein [Nocardia fluminea]